MQRTLFGAMLQAWFIVAAGIGFMSIGALGDNFPNVIGFVFVLTGAFFAVGSYIIHVCRLRRFARGEELNIYTTLVFNGILVATTAIALIFELCYALVYPYLDRADVVSISYTNKHPNITVE